MNKHLIENFFTVLGIARDDQEVPRMIRKTCQVVRFWRQIEAREEGWVFLQDSRKKYNGELCTRFSVLPFSATNLGFFRKIFGRSTAVSYVPDLLCFLFSTTNLGFFRKIVGKSTAVSYVPDLMCFLFSATNLGFFRKIVGRSTATEKSPWNFLELEEFFELDDGEKLEDWDINKEITMEDFLELEDFLEVLDEAQPENLGQDSELKLDDDQHTSGKDLGSSPKASID
ncbi:hypothetical protein YC2023_098389 [Brassica napus]